MSDVESTDDVRITFRLPLSLANRLYEVAKAEERTASQELRRLVALRVAEVQEAEEEKAAA